MNNQQTEGELKKELEVRLTILWKFLADSNQLRLNMQTIREEMKPYIDAIKQSIKDHQQDKKLFLRNQINEAKTLNKVLVSKSFKIYSQLDESYKEKLTRVKILPQFIREPLITDLPVIEIIGYINNAIGAAEAFMEQGSKQKAKE